MPRLHPPAAALCLALALGCLLEPALSTAVCPLPSSAALDVGSASLINATASAGDAYTVQWGNDGTYIYFRLSTNFMHGWMCIGISETGHMLGSDVAVVSATTAGAGQVQDYYVPWQSSPLLSDPLPAPVLDVQQDWVLTCFSRVGQSQTAVIHRKLDTGDVHQDRVITIGTLHVVYAYSATGTSDVLSYHESNRGTTQLTLRGASTAYAKPADADRAWSLSPRGINTSTTLTTQYICTGFDYQAFDPTNTPVHAVGFEPNITGLSGGGEIHHILLHACGHDATVTPVSDHLSTMPTYACQSTSQTTSGTSPLMSGACTTMMWGWALGGGALALPLEAGIVLGGSVRYLILEMHITNPNGVNEAIQAGINIQIASVLRPNNATTLQFGDPTVGGFDNLVPASNAPRTIAGGVSARHYEGNCPSTCTQHLLIGPLVATSSFLHMHESGRTIWTTRTRNSVVETVSKIEFWNFGTQVQVPTNYTIMPGDSLSTHCIYDTTKFPGGKQWGPSSDNEMCMDFVLVYPASNIVDLARCGVLRDKIAYSGAVITASICGGSTFELSQSDSETALPGGGVFGVSTAAPSAGAQDGLANVVALTTVVGLACGM